MLENPFILTLLANIFLAWVIVSLVFVLSFVKNKMLSQVDKLVAFSVGLILAIVFLWFIPEVIWHGWLDPAFTGILILSGILLFYIFELFLHWHHCKDISEDGHSHHNHEHENTNLISVGTFFHNFIHWVVLFSAFSIDIRFGIATTFAILLHAIPQNIANLLMTYKDMKYVYIAGAWGVIWALFLFPFQTFLTTHIFEILAVIAWGLLYTAMSDMLPTFKKENRVLQKWLYLVCMIIGMFFFTLFQLGEHNHWHEDHWNEIYEEIHHQNESEVHTDHDEIEEVHSGEKDSIYVDEDHQNEEDHADWHDH